MEAITPAHTHDEILHIVQRLQQRLMAMGAHRANLERDLETTKRDIMVMQGALAGLQKAAGLPYDPETLPFDLEGL